MRSKRTFMRRLAYRARIVLIVSVVCSGLAVAQEYYWETVTGAGDSTSPAAKVYYAPRKLKYVSARENDPIITVRLDRGSVIVMNTRRETYAEVTAEEWKSMRGQQSAMVFQIPPDIQKLPEEQRDRRMRELMDAQLHPNRKVDVIRIAETKTIRGYPCAKYVVKQENRVVFTVWSTRAVKEFESMRSDLVEGYRQLSLNYPALRLLPDALKGIDGFPMEYQAGDEKTTVQKIEKRIWGEDQFEAPADYRRTTPAIPGQR